jgi:putative addiction module antidote
MLKLKLTQIGNSVGLILPKEVLTLLKVEKGDSVFVTETPEGVSISPYDTSVDEQLKLGREIMREYRDTLRILSK